MRNTCFILAMHKKIGYDHCSYGENNLYQIGIHSCDKCSSRMLFVQAIKQSAILTIKMSGRFLLQNHLDSWFYFGDIQGCSVSQDVSLGCLQTAFGNSQISQWTDSIKLGLKPNHNGHWISHLNLFQVKETRKPFGDDIIEVANIWFDYCFSARQNLFL